MNIQREPCGPKWSEPFTCFDSAGWPIFLKISARVVLEPGGKEAEACEGVRVCVCMHVVFM